MASFVLLYWASLAWPCLSPTIFCIMTGANAAAGVVAVVIDGGKYTDGAIRAPAAVCAGAGDGNQAL